MEVSVVLPAMLPQRRGRSTDFVQALRDSGGGQRVGVAEEVWRGVDSGAVAGSQILQTSGLDAVNNLRHRMGVSVETRADPQSGRWHPSCDMTMYDGAYAASPALRSSRHL